MATSAPGRVALVTGASQGLGAATARRLAADGFAVVLAARRKEPLAALADSIQQGGGRALAVECDVQQTPAVDRAVERTLEEWGRLDVLVSNAGVTRDALVYKMTDDDWGAVIDTHLTGAFRAVRAAQRPMVAQRHGRIILMGSTASAGWRGQTNYSAAKAGMHGMAKTLALELGRFGITINVVSPGHIDSELTRATAQRLGVDYDSIRQDRIAQNAIKRVGVPEDVANAVSFFAADAASFVTGQILRVSGRPS